MSWNSNLSLSSSDDQTVIDMINVTPAVDVSPAAGISSNSNNTSIAYDSTSSVYGYYDNNTANANSNSFTGPDRDRSFDLVCLQCGGSFPVTKQSAFWSHVRLDHKREEDRAELEEEFLAKRSSTPPNKIRYITESPELLSGLDMSNSSKKEDEVESVITKSKTPDSGKRRNVPSSDSDLKWYEGCR